MVSKVFCWRIRETLRYNLQTSGPSVQVVFSAQTPTFQGKSLFQAMHLLYILEDSKYLLSKIKKIFFKKLAIIDPMWNNMIYAYHHEE